MDSSPDLSLKLRRGSSDSRDSFYMDFAQGIDSDIEEMNTITSGGSVCITGPIATITASTSATIPAAAAATAISTPDNQKSDSIRKTSGGVGDDSGDGQIENIATDGGRLVCDSPTIPLPPPPNIPSENVSINEEDDTISSQHPPSPSQPDNILISPETLSHHSSPSRSVKSSMKPSIQQQSHQHQHHYQPPQTHYYNPTSASATIITETPSPVDQQYRPSSRKAQHVTIDESPRLPLSLSQHNQLVAALAAQQPMGASGSGGSGRGGSGRGSHTGSGTVSGRGSPHHPHHYYDHQQHSHPLHPSLHQHQQHHHHHHHHHDQQIKSSSVVKSTSGNIITSSTGTGGTSIGGGGGIGVTATGGGGGHLALLYHHSSSHHHHHVHPILPIARRPSRLLTDSAYVTSSLAVPKIRARDALATTFSALYGKLLVVMGIAFPMAEVISTYIPPSFYEGFYLYLYIGSMVFLLFMYVTLMWGKPKLPKLATPSKARVRKGSSTDSMDESDTESQTSGSRRMKNIVIPAMRRPSMLAALGRSHYGSFYLRMGAVAFGIGSMIYSGLEFGQYFELERDTKCHNVMLALTPATRMAFIFIQMYFIFLNNEQMRVYRHKIIARFGLMHMIGTNLSVWLNVLIQETKHEILTFYNPENRTLRISHRLGNKLAQHNIETETAHLRVARGLKGPHHIFECRRSNIIGTLVQDASPFLFPCTIEYSLICAAILYVMWRGICRPSPINTPPPRMGDHSGGITGLGGVGGGIHSPCKRSPHHYSVDCARAHKGLFIGILILVLTIISLILFFVLISRPEFVSLAVTEVTICELSIYACATIATLIGMVQVRHLNYDSYRHFQLDDILLVGAQTGLFLYSTFTVIGGHFTLRRDTILVLVTALASIVQTACQTMFILDASRRNAATPEHMRRKPGREIVTFLLVANLAMWAISTLEKSRAESHPIQLNFYGLWAWTIITHVSMPLAIFYRFHSTVCLCEIWKRAYKMKPSYC